MNKRRSAAKKLRLKTFFTFFHLPPCAAGRENDILGTRSPERVRALIFENRELEIKENCNVNEIGESSKEVSC